jgi:hypothetical protein
MEKIEVQDFGYRHVSMMGRIRRVQ